jgi:1-acyl-sn-glycerol-3-phosphate acyltransferase
MRSSFDVVIALSLCPASLQHTAMGETRGSYRPFAKSLASTIAASSEVLLRSATGTLSDEAAEALIARWQRQVLRSGHVDVDVSGREHIERGRTYVVMSNHRSLLDIPTIFAGFPNKLRMVAKHELSRVPVWGPAMKALGFVFVNRGDAQRSIQELEVAKQQLRGGTSVWIAPEGTRGQQRELGRFKKGGFHLARELAAPILPAFIEGTDDVVRPGTFRVFGHRRVSVTFGPAIATSHDDDITALMERVRAAIVALRDRGS